MSLVNSDPVCLLLVISLLAACAPQPSPVAETQAAGEPKVTSSRTSNPTTTITPTTTTYPTETPQRSLTSTPTVWVCSPLEGYRIDQLAGIVANPYAPPRNGSDDPHQGVDLADIDPGSRIALEGMVVQAALQGSVASVIRDRFPYGNAVMIETPLVSLPDAWLEEVQLPTPAPTLLDQPVLTCPTPEGALPWTGASRSLYLIYGHLLDTPTLRPGETVACGEPIGKVGMTGNALNPHLHVEARVGPSGAQFDSLAHYTSSASPDEMRNYCLWRVSNNFQLVDPLALLSNSP
jgi:murein DD-endopeptidase MepM/ murein hydrolase activator NlpD